VVIGIVVLAFIIGVLGMMFPVGLQDPADPLNTPLHVKPEWYFLALYQLLKYVPPTVIGIEGPVLGVVVILLAVLALVFWPFLDRKSDSKKATWIRLGLSLFILVLFIALTIWGEVS